MATRARSSSKNLSLSATTVGGVQPFSTQRVLDVPADVKGQMTRARHWAIYSGFMSSYLKTKRAFYNFGFEVKTGPSATGDAKALTKWLDKDAGRKATFVDPSTRETVEVEFNMTNRDQIQILLDDIWDEFLTIDNCVIFHTDEGMIITLPPEKCRYLETLGVPVLYYTHGLSYQEIALLDSEQQQRFRQRSEILINPQYGEHFRIIKRTPVGTTTNGSAFGTPNMYSIFRLLGQVDAMEEGMYASSYLMRTATRWHRLGHAIEWGQMAGQPKFFHNDFRGKSVLAAYKDRVGPHDYTSNFDQTMEYPWPAMDRFDETCWKGSDRRLRVWGGPIAQMMTSEKMNENALQMLLSLASDDRRRVARAVLPVIIATLNPPKNLDIRFCWSDSIFFSASQATDLLKFSVTQGLASCQTARAQLGLDNQTEDANKVMEADDSEATKKYMPMWDSSHGISPALGESTAKVEPTATPAATAKKPAKGADKPVA